MFKGVSLERMGNMTAQEERWLENAKKAFAEADRLYSEGTPRDGAIQRLCVAVDTLKTLYRSLQGDHFSHDRNRARFIAFLEQELPCDKIFDAFDARRNERIKLSLAEVFYEVRCMDVHENDNLDFRDNAQHHVVINWNSSSFFTGFDGDRVYINGEWWWKRLRQIVAKYITAANSGRSFASSGIFKVTCSPKLGQIRSSSI